MSKNLFQTVVLIFAIGVSSCNSSGAQVENLVVETTVEANSTTSTILDPRKIAVNKLANWTWQPSLDETLRQLNVAQFDFFVPVNLSSIPFDSWLLGFPPLGCTPLFSLSNLMSIDGINLPKGSGGQTFNSSNYLTVSVFLANVGSDNNEGLASRYDKILASKGDYCSGDEFLTVPTDCEEVIVVPQFEESCAIKDRGSYESKLSWLGTQAPTFAESYAARFEKNRLNDVLLTTTSVMREGFAKQSSSKSSIVIQEYLTLIEPIGYSLFVRVLFLVSKNQHNFDLNEGINIVDTIGPLVAKQALEDIKFKLNN